MLISTILRTITSYILLLIITRLMGRKMISQMTFFDFTVGVTVGTVTGSIALSPKYTPLSAGFTLLILLILTFITGYINIKSFMFRKRINSEPVLLIENGKINNINMKKIRLTINELMLLLRKKNIFNIGDVEFALMEVDGQLSVLPKSQKQPVTPNDLNLDTPYKGLMKDFIIDGEIMVENLTDANLDEIWLRTELDKKGIIDIEKIFYAGLDTSGNLYISEKRKEKESEGKHGIE